jgi:DNA-binding response OmpR family regulator
MKLLIAEDDILFVKVLGQVLAQNHEVIVTRDGNEAWAVLQSPDAPRLAILDWVMPGLSGPEICRRVRACPPLSSMYLIILTAKNNAADIVSGLRAGADDYITKPPVPEELRARLAIGERVLSLQDAVETQSALAHEAAEREKSFRARLANGCFPSIVQENLSEVAAYLKRHAETEAFCSSPCPGNSSSKFPASYSLENSHY